MLCARGAAARRYRILFYLNGAHNSSSTEWMLNSKMTLRDELLVDGYAQEAASLRTISDLLSRLSNIAFFLYFGRRVGDVLHVVAP
eukprot:2752949-Karenia_brevis.AAC.1